MFFDDFETHALVAIHEKMLGTALLDPDEMSKLQTHIRARKEMVRLGEYRAPTWFIEELLKLDSKMRVWWDSWKEKWVLDRLQEEGFYVTVLQFRPTPDFQLDFSLIEALKANDLQREGVADHIARKRAEAEEIRKRNAQVADNKVLAAIDGMSSKQIKEFLEVAEAIETGDPIQPHGDDLNTIEAGQREIEAIQKRGEAIDFATREIIREEK